MSICDDYRREVEAEIAALKKYLALLESGKLTLGEREGNGPWRDTTQEAMARDRQTIRVYENILEQIKKGKSP